MRNNLDAGYRLLRWPGAASAVCLVLVCTGCGSAEPEPISSTAGPLQSKSVLQPTAPSLCWVQDSASTLTNTQFLAQTAVLDEVISTWEGASALEFDFRGRCSADSTSAPANSNFVENIRIFYNEFNRKGSSTPPFMIAGRGCTRDNGNGNNAYYPSDDDHRCQWNATLSHFDSGNVLHEVGHALGWIHEHERSDNDSGCNTVGSPTDGYWLTRYDLRSVMHYNGCISHDSLSARDSLGSEIAYPASGTVKLGGGGMAWGSSIVIRLDSLVQTDWAARGAADQVFTNVEWSNSSGIVSTAAAFPASNLYAEGDTDTLSVTFEDPWGATKTGSQDILVSNAAHAAVVMSSL